MALNRKYAALPDLDSAPDIYETPELTDDNSTAPTGTVHSQSGSSDYRDFDEDEGADDTAVEGDGPSAISRSRLHPDEARERFEPARIDARDVDFSDRLSSKRKSYKASSRRYKKRQDGTEELGDISDEEDGESLERRMARLRREIEEVKEEAERRQREAKVDDTEEGQGKRENGAVGDDAAELSRILDSIALRGSEPGSTPGTRLAKALSSSLSLAKSASTSTAGGTGTAEAIPSTATYTVTYAPSYPQNHALAKAADFDSRLTLLETALGISNLTALANGSSNNRLEILGDSVKSPLLPTVNYLQQQISVLVESSPSSLDAISRRVRALTQETEKLTEARRTAKMAQDDLRASRRATGDSADIGTGESVENEEDDEATRKISALYGTLPTIERLAPLLPGILERLRSLRIVHAEAATAKEGIDNVMKRQQEMAKEMERWKQGIDKLEEAVKQAEVTMKKNTGVVDGWVGGLDERLKKLGV